MADLGTELDASYTDDATRATALRVLERLGAADLIDMLGLGIQPQNGLQTCPVCGHRREGDGRPCRRKTCAAGSTRRPGGAQ